jgi:hypothetical protein
VWFYHDGVKVAEVRTGGAFDEPMFLIFDTEAWVLDAGLPTLESLQNQMLNAMQVDWVASWRLVASK